MKTRLELLAAKNNLSFNKMIIYILELGYQDYLKRFENEYKGGNKN